MGLKILHKVLCGGCGDCETTQLFGWIKEKYASWTNNNQPPTICAEKPASLLCELLQAELGLWTFSLSALFGYVLSQRKRYFAFNCIVVAPAVVAATSVLSTALVPIVFFGRLFDGSDDAPSSTSGGSTPRCYSMIRSRSSSSASSSNCSCDKADALCGSRESLNYFWHAPAYQARKLSGQVNGRTKTKSR